MSELKAGCRALIIGGFYRTNDGKSVLVEQFVPSGESFIFNGLVRDGETGEAKRLGFGLIPGKYLMPLDDDFNEEAERQEEIIHG